jgi:hypothetical protein
MPDHHRRQPVDETTARPVAPILAGIAIAACLLFWALANGHESEPHGAPSANRNQPQNASTRASEAPDSVHRTADHEGPVRVEHRRYEGPEVDSDQWSRQLTDQDLRYCQRQVRRVLKTTDKVFDLDIADPTEREQRMAELFRIRVQCQAVQRLLAEAKGFMTKSLLRETRNDEDQFVWTMLVHYKDEGDLILNVPIDLTQFPEVRDWRTRSAAINAFSEQGKGASWNALGYAERRRIVDAAERARAAIPSLRERIEVIQSIPSADRTDLQRRTYAELTAELDAAYEAERQAPPHYDPTTLEWRFRRR